MIVDPARPARPALRYYGGKYSIAPWIISHFPPHTNYLEPCSGGASVILAKPRSKLETINDIDGDVFNFFRVLRDQPDELIRRIHLTPWARAEYEADGRALLSGGREDVVEWARLFWVVCWMSYQGGTSKNVKGLSWRSGRGRKSKYETVRKAVNDGINIDHLYAVAARLKEVQIESRDWTTCFKVYDNPQTLTYFDPPYVPEKRSAKKRYAYEWTNADHVEAAEVLRAGQGFVMMCPVTLPRYTRSVTSRVAGRGETAIPYKRIAEGGVLSLFGCLPGHGKHYKKTGRKTIYKWRYYREGTIMGSKVLKKDRLWGYDRDPRSRLCGALVTPEIYLWDAPIKVSAAREGRRAVAMSYHDAEIYIREEETIKHKGAPPTVWHHVVDMKRGVSGWVMSIFLQEAGEPSE